VRLIIVVETRKAQLMQRGTRNSGACLKARCEQNLLAMMFLLHSSEGGKQPVSLSRRPVGLKSQIFRPSSHLASSLLVTSFEYIKKLYGS